MVRDQEAIALEIEKEEDEPGVPVGLQKKLESRGERDDFNQGCLAVSGDSRQKHLEAVLP
jgi:hypothetical protein